ncbi:MAG: C40 family peptidase [Firmicutes bacterium]|nr:C40 family peptidase [Bacillota bacterium]
MIRYRGLVLFFGIFSLLAPVSLVFGEAEQNALEHTALAQTVVPEPNVSEHAMITTERLAVVTGDYVNLRAAADYSAAVINRLMRGRQAAVLENTGSWTRVRLADGTEGWIFNKYITIVPATTASRGPLPSLTSEILSYARSFLGAKYVYGGASPQGFDCSGFTSYIFNKFALQLPHEALLQSGVGEKVPTVEDLLPGDLVFFKTQGASNVNHVGIYLGNSQFIHASSGRGSVTISRLDTGYYKNCYAGARRLGSIASFNDSLQSSAYE